MKDGKQIIIICPWLDATGPAGVFFKEQAKLVSDEYDVTLLHTYTYGIKEYLASGFTGSRCEKLTTDVGVPMSRYSHLQSRFLPRFINDFFERELVQVIGRDFNLKKLKNVLIHAQSIRCSNSGSWAYKLYKKFGTPYLVTEHDQFILQNTSTDRLTEIRNIVNDARNVLVVSNDKARQILNNGFQCNFKVVGNLVNEEVFYPAETSNNEIFRIITIGAYSFLKDTQTIFEMLRLLDKGSYAKKIEFLYVGFDGWGGDLSAQIAAIIKEMNLKNVTTRLVPLASRIEVAEMLRSSDVFVFSSISEGMPVSVMEALATGIPVCTTQCGGVDELITDFNGKIIPIRDYHAMYSFVDKCITGELTFDKTKISEHLLQEYGVVAFKQRLVSFYNNSFDTN